jgi:predicted alpha-1,2-mannosidase
MKLITLVFAFSLSFSLFAQKTVSTDFTQFVNPFIGTAGTGHTFPGACLPFGFVQLSPDNEKRGWDFCSGYNSSDSIIIGFSHTHLSGTGCGDLQDVMVMPTTKALVSDTSKQGFNFIYNYKSTFLHSTEQASPGYYSVMLEDSKIKAELTSTLRAGMHRYTFRKNAEPKIVIDLSSKGGWNKNLVSSISVLNDSTVVGSLCISGWAVNRTVYFTAIFSKQFKTYYTSTRGELNSQIAERKGNAVKFIACFDKNQNAPILLKVGISSVSIEGATKNLRTEMPSFNFEGVKTAAKAVWQKELAKFKVESDDLDRKKIFYTALYHSFIHPSILSDVDGKYTGADGQIHSTTGTNRYHVFSLWDTFRALHPLITLTDPKRATDFVKSMLAHYNEFGMLPNWELWGNDTYCMIGYHSFPVIVDAYLKGLVDKNDVEKVYVAMKNNAMFSNKNRQHKGLEMYIQYGFMPYDVQMAYCAKNGYSNLNESASRTLEWAFDDACLARMAKALGKTDDAAYFQKRSEAYKFLADTTTLCMRPHNADGTLLTPFNPEFAQIESGFTEVNALQSAIPKRNNFQTVFIIGHNDINHFLLLQF